MKNVLSIISIFLNIIMFVFSEKVLVHNKAIKNMRYKKVLIDENPKTEFSDMKKKKYIYIKIS